jgi:hypothetical protein
LKRRERLIVLAKLEIAVAHDAVVPVVGGPLGAGALGFANRLAKPVLRQVDGAEHATRFVRPRIGVEDLLQRLLGAKGGTGRARDPRLPQQRIRERHRSDRIGGLLAQAALHCLDRVLKTLARRDGSRSGGFLR